jgi:hypothetical protein
MLSDAHDIATEMVIFQEIESPEIHPFSERLDELIEQAGDIKEALLHYLADTAQGARRVSLSTIHFLKDSLGKSLSSHSKL